MRLKLKTRVAGTMNEVYEAFDERLFKYLLPPGANLLRFDGSQPGDKVRLRFGFPFYAEWESTITEQVQSTHYRYFVDIGTQLPFGLSQWKHTHIVRVTSRGTEIHDIMEYSTGNSLLNMLYLPALYLAFFPRLFQYKRYFKSYFAANPSERIALDSQELPIL
jgi:hypothetical protein